MTEALITSLEQAGEGSRELDARVAGVFSHDVESDDGDFWWGPFDQQAERVPDFTTSLDAALALASRVLPGWSYGLFGEVGDGATASLTQPDVDIGGGVIASPGLMGLDEFEGEAATPALALCLAVLRATNPKGQPNV